MAKDLFNRYVWLVDTIYRAERITFEEICAKWERSVMSSDDPLPLRTFHNHRKAIEELFDINIECDKRGGYVYYIENADDLARGGVRSWLLNTFAVNNLINESHKLKSRILFENIPSGQRFLAPIIEAMRDSVAITMTYQSFWSDKPNTFDVQPYCVKVFKQRWYVVGRSPYYNRVMIYALDRMQSLEVLDTKFKLPKEFDPEGYFYNCFGIITDEDVDVEDVALKVYGNQVKYLQALPIHHSQQEVETNGDYSVFHYQLKPTYDFVQEVLSQGEAVEVLSPTYVRDKIAKTIATMAQFYK